MDKIDYKKVYKECYRATAKPVVVDVAPMQFLALDGVGDPTDSPQFHSAIEALFGLAYTIKFMLKKGPMALDFAVMPLEGLWWTDDMTRFMESRAAWKWRVMIMQPPVVTNEIVEEARVAARKKGPSAALDQVRLERFDEGKAVQILHMGPFSEEGPAVEKLHQFAREQGFQLSGKHHEIYLSDARRTAPEKRKTIIRQPVSR